MKSNLRKPTKRQRIFDIYWQFAAERQRIFERRVAGEAPPWTTDPIFKRYKFCNVYRAADRVSQYMIRDVVYHPFDDKAADRLFQIVAFRTFSKIATWDGLISLLGKPPSIADLKSGRLDTALDSLKTSLGGLYTGAFILCATKAYGFDQKHKNHTALFRQMFVKENAADHVLNAPSFEAVVRFLETFPLTGPFMSYQIAVDLNYSSLLSFGESDYTQAGPGALRGIKKAFEDIGDYSPEEVIQSMVESQDLEFRRLGLKFNGLWGRPLQAIDCQGLFCELDKYCREAAPELLSARSRIKTIFEPTSAALPLFFPPKWGINDKLPKARAEIPGLFGEGIARQQ